MPLSLHTSVLLVMQTVLVLLAAVEPVFAFQITGVQSGVDPSGARPTRLEINNLANAGPLFDLYMLALQAFQNVNQSDPLSYYQIAGIHGYPHAPWDGVQGNQSLPGYCTHQAIYFATWHRPYVALFEQVLWSHAQTIAQQYPNTTRTTYVAAAQVLRAPYWDWIANPTLPSVASSPTITVNAPNGSTTIPNPLYQYNFQQGRPTVDLQNGYFSQFSNTVRHFDGTGSNISGVNAACLANAATLRSLAYQMFSTANFGEFVTTAAPSDNPVSLEYIHNGIHDFVGGDGDTPGHMTDLTVSAFDPVFWLHHCNVDRFFAMWEALHPNAWITPMANLIGTYTDPPGLVVTGDTPLTPFHSDNGTTLFTSNGVRGTKIFGYSYPEIQDWNNTAANLAAQVASYINALYNFNIAPSPQDQASTSVSRSQDAAESFGRISIEEVKSLRVNNLAVQWSIRVQVPRAAYPGSFAIDFFMGHPPESKSAWSTAPNLIGSFVNLASPPVGKSHAVVSAAGSIHGGVSLTHIIAAGTARGVIKDPSIHGITSVLTEHLNWRGRSLDGHEISLDELCGLRISVTSQAATPIKRMSELPQYGPIRTHLNVTMHKLGGAT